MGELSSARTDPGAKAGVAALIVLVAAQFILVADSSIVNIALPTIQADLRMAPSELSWVVNAYVLVFGGFLLVGGRLADLTGRRRMFVVGVAVFTVASLLGGLAQNAGWLFAARAAQGLGAAITSPAALSLLSTTFPEGRPRDRALGVWGAAVGAGGAFGVLLGGVLTSGLGWEWVMFINVPVGLLVMVFTPRLLPPNEPTRTGRVDMPGAVTITVGLAMLIWALVDAERTGWTDATLIARLLAAVVLAGSFVLIETRSNRPLVPFSIFGNRAVSSANILNLLLSMTLLAMFYFISLYLQEVLGFTALVAGLAYLPLTISITVTSQLTGRLVNHLGFRSVTVAGLVVLATGLAWFTQLRASGTYAVDVLGPSLLCGAGMGISLVGLTIAAMANTSPDQAGLASGLITTTQQIGGALGLAVMTSVAVATTTISHDGTTAADPTSGFHAAFLVAACLAFAAALLALVILRKPHQPSAQGGE